jgi:hypothetical protein
VTDDNEDELEELLEEDVNELLDELLLLEDVIELLDDKLSDELLDVTELELELLLVTDDDELLEELECPDDDDELLEELEDSSSSAAPLYATTIPTQEAFPPVNVAPAEYAPVADTMRSWR